MKTYTLQELLNMIYGLTENQPTTRRPAPPSPPPQNDLGSIYDADSLKQAIELAENEQKDADAEYNRAKNQRLAQIQNLRSRLEKEQTKTKMVRKGTDVAITMTHDSAVNLLEQLTNLLNGSNSEFITVNLSNVR